MKKRRDMPLTGILAGIVIVLIIVLGIMIGLFVKMQQTKEQKLQSAQNAYMETGEMQQTESGTAEENPGTESTERETESDDSKSENTEAQDENAESERISEEVRREDGLVDIAVETESETETEAEKLVVAIDPGHQGSWVDMSDKEPNGPGSSEMKTKATTGTEGRFSGKKEYELNLEVSLLLREELKARGYEVILTREDHDTAISNAERALLAYDEGGDIYVRIHANGADSSSVSGALAMVPSANNPYVGDLAEDSYLLGQCILDAYCSKASFQSLGIQYYDNMTGINWSKLPVMILEMGFMTNESDDLRMADPAVQEAMAEGIADGIDAYFEQKGMKQKEVPEEDQEQVNAVLEMIGEEYVYPLSDQGETWAVSLKDLVSGAQGDLNGDVQMKSASVIKVFIMAAIYDRVCYPSSEERRISYPESYDGELKQLITDMITVSDNTAANTLLAGLGGGDAKAGMEIVNQFCEENGYTNTSMGRLFLEENPAGDNYTSANDCLTLLEGIYRGTCVNGEASEKMLAYLEQQTRRGKIPAGLEGTAAAVANKTGELAGEYGDYVENDIAVIEENGQAYVLCVLSGGVQDNGEAIGYIEEISRMVYEQVR